MNLHEIGQVVNRPVDPEPLRATFPINEPRVVPWPFLPQEPPITVPRPSPLTATPPDWSFTPLRYTAGYGRLETMPANPFYETMTYPAAGYARRSISMSRRFALSSLSTRLEAIRDTANIMIALAIAHPAAFGWRVRAESDPMSDMVIVEWNQYE